MTAGRERRRQHIAPVKSECIESPEPLKDASRSASSSAQEAPSSVRSSFRAEGDSRFRRGVPVLCTGKEGNYGWSMELREASQHICSTDSSNETLHSLLKLL